MSSSIRYYIIAVIWGDNMENDMKAFLAALQKKLKSIDYVKTEDIPNIGLYMDQVTTFMDEQLEAFKRYDQDHDQQLYEE